MSDDVLPKDFPDLAAVELALGLLDGEERAAALRRRLAEPAFAREVEMWRGHLAELFALWPEVAPPADGLARLERALDRPPVIAPRSVRSTGRLWPAVAAASSLIAACLLLFVLLRPPGPAPVAPAPVAAAPTGSPMLVAAIAPSAGGEPAAAVYDPGAGKLTVTATTLADADHSPELWVIGGDGVPHSLGLLDTKGATSSMLKPADRTRLSAGSVLAVSIEPIGGSPTGQPTGPVVAKGALSLA